MGNGYEYGQFAIYRQSKYSYGISCRYAIFIIVAFAARKSLISEQSREHGMYSFKYPVSLFSGAEINRNKIELMMNNLKKIQTIL